MRWQIIAAFALILAACMTVVPDIPQPASFVLFGVVFVAVCAWALLNGETPVMIAARPGVLVGTLAVWLALIIGFVVSPTLDGLLRVGAFVVFTGSALFVLPSFIPRTTVYRMTAIVAAVFSVFALITALTGTVGILDIWRRTSLAGIHYGIPMSVFGNPNTLAGVALFGALAASGGALSIRQDDTLANRGGAAILAAYCALAVVLSGSRGAMLALVAGGGVLFVARIAHPRTTAIVTLGGLVALVGALSVAANTGISFSGRFDLWGAAISAAVERPVFGWGPGAGGDTLASFLPSGSRYADLSSHNSYLRMFFISGIVGGIGYICLCASALRSALMTADETTLALVVAALIVFIFETGSIFGLSPVSFISALAFGYAQQHESDSGSLPLVARSTNIWQWEIDHLFTRLRRSLNAVLNGR